ncbi:MAG: elongation factor P [Chloracidobacterium sp. CP2_5A]|nr:MAG: elongation factor P [Chloracidobacterium sp. CP2_5A]
MLSTSDFKRGAHILVDGEPYAVLDWTVQTPSARGAATLVRTRVRHVLTNAVLEKTFKSGDKFDEPDVDQREVQFLYESGGEYYFLDQESYEQHALPASAMDSVKPYLTENAQLKALFYEGNLASVELPQFLEFEVVETEPGARGDTAAGKVTKPAKISTGASVKVPLYIEVGERIVVDTTTGDFTRRAKS